MQVLCEASTSDSLHFQTNTDAVIALENSEPERSAWYAAEIRARDVPSHEPEKLATTRAGTCLGILVKYDGSVLGIQTTEGMLEKQHPLHPLPV